MLEKRLFISDPAHDHAAIARYNLGVTVANSQSIARNRVEPLFWFCRPPSSAMFRRVKRRARQIFTAVVGQ